MFIVVLKLNQTSFSQVKHFSLIECFVVYFILYGLLLAGVEADHHYFVNFALGNGVEYLLIVPSYDLLPNHDLVR